MKKKYIIIGIIVAVLAIAAVVVGFIFEDDFERMGDRIEDELEGGKPASQVALTQAEAEDIALKDAGFEREQVERLYTSYETDDGVPQYDVSFRVGEMEYEYEIHADSGKILSFDQESIYD